jgi:hypothetical protein
VSITSRLVDMNLNQGYVQIHPINDLLVKESKLERIDLSVFVLGLLITSYYYVVPLGRFSFGGFLSDFRIYDFAFVVFVLIVGIKQLPRFIELVENKTDFNYLSVLLIGLIWFSLAITAITGGMDRFLPALIRAVRFSAYLIAAGYVVVLVDSPRKFRFIFAIIYANIVIQSLLAFAQGLKLLPSFWPDYWLSAYGDLPVGTLSPHHKQIGVVMILGISLSFTLIRSTKNLFLRALLLLLLSVMVIVPILALSRTAWLGIIGFLLAYFYRHRAKGLIMIGLVSLILLGLFYFGQDSIRQSLVTDINSVLIDRLDRYGFAGIAGDRLPIYFSEYPEAIYRAPWILVIGTGFQNISVFMGPTGAHNNYFQAFFELGIIGFIVFVLLLFRILKSLTATSEQTAGAFYRLLAQDIWVAFIAIMLTMFVGETLWAQYSMFTLTGQIMTVVALAISPSNWLMND